MIVFRYGTLAPDSCGDINPELLPISRSLKDDFLTWSAEFNRLLNRDDPAATSFPDAETEQAFLAKGQALADRLQEELGEDYRVVYRPS